MPGVGRIQSRWAIYGALSLTLAGGVVLKSLAQRPNFYSAAVYLSQSSANLMVLANFVFVAACTVLLSLQRALYGPLRPSEIEVLYEKAWFAVTETCLAMTIFRGEIGAWFLVMFFALLVSKVWGWIAEGRVEILEQQPPRDPRWFYSRLATSIGISLFFNLTMFERIVKQVMDMAKPDMMVMFAFEFAVMSIISLTTAGRYVILLVEIGIVRGQKRKRIEQIRKERIDTAMRDARSSSDNDNTTTATTSGGISTTTEPEAVLQAARQAAARPIDSDTVEVEGWEAKGRLMFYLDLTSDFLKLCLYISFFFILLTFYGLPLHIMRDVFLTVKSFVKRIGDFLRYRTATRDMNSRYPDATESEVGRAEVCIICREDMHHYVAPGPSQPRDPLTERMRPKKLPCGHVLHFACLRSWLERQQMCPTCRASVVPRPQRTVTTAVPTPAPNEGQPRRAQPRVFRLGPLRIGVGAARGDEAIGRMQEQMANIGGPQGPRDRQFELGIQWGGDRTRRGRAQAAPSNVQQQLEATERQIQRELDQLQTAMGELQALRNIQAQMTRIRMARQQSPSQAVPQTVPGQPSFTLPQMRPSARPAPGVLHSGSDQLPDGLTLPAGWTMLPLYPAGSPHGLHPPPPPPQVGMPNGTVGQIPIIPAVPGLRLPDVTNLQMTVTESTISPPMQMQRSLSPQGMLVSGVMTGNNGLGDRVQSAAAAVSSSSSSSDATPSEIQGIGASARQVDQGLSSANAESGSSWGFPSGSDGEHDSVVDGHTTQERPSEHVVQQTQEEAAADGAPVASASSSSDRQPHVSDAEDADEDGD